MDPTVASHPEQYQIFRFSPSMDEREKILGFLPQKEKIYNKYLPYADHLDVESNAVFAEIKANLGKSVALRDIKTGANHWSGQLTR